MPYRIHRSPLFWLGLVTLLFLGFVWQDSLRHSTNFSFKRGLRETKVVISNSSFQMDDSTLPEDAIIWGPQGFGYRRYELLSPPLLYFPSSFYYHHPGIAKLAPRITRLDVPVWMILAAHTLIWSGLLCWRWQLRRRLLLSQAVTLPFPAGPNDRPGFGAPPLP